MSRCQFTDAHPDMAPGSWVEVRCAKAAQVVIVYRIPSWPSKSKMKVCHEHAALAREDAAVTTELEIVKEIPLGVAARKEQVA